MQSLGKGQPRGSQAGRSDQRSKNPEININQIPACPGQPRGSQAGKSDQRSKIQRLTEIWYQQAQGLSTVAGSRGMAPTKANCFPKSPTNLLDCLHINNDTGNTRQKYPSLGPKQNGVPTTAVTGDTVDRPKLPARGTVCTQTEIIQPSKKHSNTPHSGWIPQLYPIKMRLGPASAIEYFPPKQRRVTSVSAVDY